LRVTYSINVALFFIVSNINANLWTPQTGFFGIYGSDKKLRISLHV
jgi:hypothetical protein